MQTKDLALYQLYVEPAYIPALIKIRNKAGQTVPLIPNPAQKQYIRDMTSRDLIAKPRQLGFCLHETTKILTADLRWVPISTLSEGDIVVAVDEHVPGGRGKGRSMRTATVEGVVHHKLPAYKILFDDGRFVICTDKHPWLSKKVGTEYEWRTIEGPKKICVGTQVRWITQPWGDSDVEDGWFGGMIDGEGSFKIHGSAGISVCQRHGPVWDRLINYLTERGYRFCIESDNNPVRPNKFGVVPCPKVVVGRSDELFRLVGQTRPTRFINNHWWDGHELPGKKTGKGVSTVVSIEYIGDQLMVDLQTSTGTYIAEGFISHNTTIKLAEGLLAAMLFGQRRFLLSHETKVTERFLRTVRFMRDNLPAEYKVPAKEDNKGELVFDHTGGSITIGTARAKAFGRGDTIDGLHWSETAWTDPIAASNIWTGIKEAVPTTGTISLESTANGQAGVFFEEVMRAHRGESEFKLHFFPWWYGSEYTDPSIDSWAQLGELTEEEARLISVSGLTPGQIAWRRLHKKDMGILFQQEYPEDLLSAFLSAGSTYFDLPSLETIRLGCHPPIEVLPDGLRIWQRPAAGVKYMVSADIGGGGQSLVSPDEDTILGDRSAATVYNNRSEIVATYRGIIKPSSFSQLLLNWGHLYNDAMIAPERNMFGDAVIQVLVEAAYPSIYMQQKSDKSWVYGWSTNSASRPLLLTSFEEAIRTGTVTFWDRDLSDECATFVSHQDNIGRTTYAASRGSSDDLLFAAMIGYYLKDETMSVDSKPYTRPGRWK